MVFAGFVMGCVFSGLVVFFLTRCGKIKWVKKELEKSPVEGGGSSPVVDENDEPDNNEVLEN